MVDRIKMKNEKVYPEMTNLGKPYSAIPQTDKTINYYFNLYRTDDSKIKESLRIKINDNKSGLEIDGSLRKWWFGASFLCRDFDYQSFCLCITAISERLGIEQISIWESDITYLEIGGNIKLSRKLDFVIPSMINYPRYWKLAYKEESTYFKSSKQDIVVYDKVKEFLKNKSEKFRSKICEGLFVMRFEIKLKQPKATVLGNRVDKLYKIKNNWGYLVNHWVQTFQKIEFCKIQNPDLIMKGKNLSRTEIKEYCVAVCINTFGYEPFYSIINKHCYKTSKSDERKNLRVISEKYQIDNLSGYIDTVSKAVSEKAEKMKKFSQDF